MPYPYSKRSIAPCRHCNGVGVRLSNELNSGKWCYAFLMHRKCSKFYSYGFSKN